MWYLLGVALGVVALTRWMYKWGNPKCNGVLPPGSMGLPLIGETFQFFKASKSIDISAFVKIRINKYGQMFKTNLAGRPVVVSADPELNHYILQQEGRLVELWYMDSFAKIMGLSESAKPGAAPTNSIGHIHKITKNLILTKIGINKLKGDMLSQMENAARKALNAWASSPGSIDVKEAFAAMVFDLNASVLFGYEPEKWEDNMSSRLSSIMPGLMSLPLNVRGTAFHKSMQNQKVLLGVMKELMDERLASPDKRRDDLLDLFIDGMKTEESTFITHDFIIYAMFGLLFGSVETVSTVICLALNYLSDQPDVVKELEEQKEILGNKKPGESMLSWKEYKSMTFTMQVVNEALRMANAVPGLLRRATEDIHVNGYTIPKGWTIMILASTLHMNPETYQDPLSFIPWRWKDLDPSVVAKNFMPFGWGMRTCVGAEFSKAILAVFLHNLVSNYTWQKVKGGEISRAPGLLFGDDGFHIKVFKKHGHLDMHV